MEKENEKATGKGNAYNGEDDDQIQIRDESSKEEEKMEQFFALIKNFHDARNRRKQELQEAKRNNKIIKLDHHQESTNSSSWVPKFEWQDFTQDIEFVKPPPILPSPCNHNHNHNHSHKHQDNKRRRHIDEDDDGTDLDLKLTL